MSELGATVETPARPDGRCGDTVVGTFDGRAGGPRALLIGHMDTVFDRGHGRRAPVPDRRRHRLRPGVTDMKSGLLAGAVRAQGARRASAAALPFERLVFVANPDEEIGSPTSTPHIREVAPRPWTSCFVLECARANGDIVSARKGIARPAPHVHGRAAHAGVEPEKGRSAILEAARIVERAPRRSTAAGRA